MIKDLIVNLSLSEKPDSALDYAISVASKFNAHVAGLSFAYEPIFPPIDMVSVPAEIIEQQYAENERLAVGARDRFEELIKRNSLSGESRVIRETLGTAADTFARLTRRFDLSILKQPEPGSTGNESLVVEAALFYSGRPILVVPYIQRTGLALEHVMVCWDGSRTAARAIADAKPFLTQAKTVEIVTVEDNKPDLTVIPGADLAHHLARHGIKVDLKNIVASGIDTANLILSHAADTSADLIVMGGYGHSRLREFVLGGVTRGLLESMTAPTLMSH